MPTKEADILASPSSLAYPRSINLYDICNIKVQLVNTIIYSQFDKDYFIILQYYFHFAKLYSLVLNLDGLYYENVSIPQLTKSHSLS